LNQHLCTEYAMPCPPPFALSLLSSLLAPALTFDSSLFLNFFTLPFSYPIN